MIDPGIPLGGFIDARVLGLLGCLEESLAFPLQRRLLSADVDAPMIRTEFIASIRGTQSGTRTN
jgi:hypothetical protein